MSEVQVEAAGGASIQILLLVNRRTSTSGMKILTIIPYYYTIYSCRLTYLFGRCPIIRIL